MSYKFSTTLNTDGRVTIPADIRERLGIKPGDRLDVQLSAADAPSVSPDAKRSIFENLKDLPPLSLGRPLTQQDIDDAIGEEMVDQENRIRKQYEK